MAIVEKLIILTMKKFVLLLDLMLKTGVFLCFGLLLRLLKSLSKSDVPDKRVVVVSPPGGGNIGDEALVQATLQKFAPFHCDVYVNNRSAFHAETLSDANVYEVPKLVYGNALGLLRTLIERRQHFICASHIAIIGADIIDGAYNEKASFTRIWLAIFGRLLGCNVRILGFSLNSNPKGSCKLSLRVAQRLRVALFLRDPVSYSRAVKLGLTQATACADVVFCDNRKDVYPLPADIGDSPFVIINVSGLIFKEDHSTSDLTSIVDHIIQKGLKIILLPHVSRAGADDIDVCDKLYDSLPQHHERIAYIRHLLTPKKVRYLCARSVFVLSGRMHLGVMALSQRKCAFIFSSQGKVEGLLKMFGFSAFEIDNTTPYCDRVEKLIDEVVNKDIAVADAALRAVIDLADRNFIDVAPSPVIRAVA